MALLARISLKGEKVFEGLEAVLQCWGLRLRDTQVKIRGKWHVMS